MKDQNLGERTSFRGYSPDRCLAFLVMLGQVAQIAYLLWWYVASWKADPQRSSLSIVEWMGQNGYWNGALEYGRETLLNVWCATGIAKGRGWAFGLMIFLSTRGLILWAGHFDEAQFGTKTLLLLSLLSIVYCALRLFGSLGPKVSGPTPGAR